MTLTTPSATGLPGPTAGGLEAVLGELQRLKTVVVAGANANTNIAIAGIVTSDTLQSVLRHVDPGAATTAAVVDHTAQASITSNGNIQVTVATNTNAGDRLVVTYWDKA